MAESEEVRKKASKMLASDKVKKTIETGKRIHFSVQGETENHSVIFDKERNMWSCDCKYFALTQRQCSHIVAAKYLARKA